MGTQLPHGKGHSSPAAHFSGHFALVRSPISVPAELLYFVTEPACAPPPEPEPPYVKQIRGLDEHRQQMESSNRWRQLESETPAHDVGALRRKVIIVAYTFFNLM